MLAVFCVCLQTVLSCCFSGAKSSVEPSFQWLLVTGHVVLTSMPRPCHVRPIQTIATSEASDFVLETVTHSR